MKKVMALCGAAVLAAGIAACSSSTSSISGSAATAKASASSMSGTETVSGSVSGSAALANNPSFTLTWRGPVNTTSEFATGGNAPAKGQHHTFKTAAGNLTVVVSAAPTNTQKLLSASSCRFEVATAIPYKVDGAASTGKFAGATGDGVATLTFRADLPKLANGKCNESNNAQPLAKGAVARFSIAGPLTVKS
ncbi:MAG: hypothetical protein JOY82_12730 [Streptosporangiaceae bacterium]|nr:hypothetical protein [Streptosporangiaceae bacterium]MBV9855360.1 hypothetical protein [Streptosporangiaceae bacterium]